MKLHAILLAALAATVCVSPAQAAEDIAAITTTPVHAAGKTPAEGVGTQSVAGDVANAAAAWLALQQHGSGAFPWTPGGAATSNTQGATALGLLRAYERNGQPAQLTAALATGGCLLVHCVAGMTYADGDHRFATHDPLFLEELSRLSGDSAYADMVQSAFWDKLQPPGTYGAADNLDAAGFAAAVVSGRGSIGELAAWDLSKVAIAAHLAGEAAVRDAMLAAIQESLELPTGATHSTYDVIGLAGAIWAAAITGAPLDPTAGLWASAGSTNDLGDILRGFQTPGGGFVTGSNEPLVDGNATAQATAFAMLALHALDPVEHAAAINSGFGFLLGLQQPDGQFLSYPGATAASTGGVEAHGEALEAYAVGRLGTDRYVDPSGVDSGDCSQPALPCETIQFAVDRANEGNTIHIASGVYADPVDVATAGLRLVGEGATRPVLQRFSGPVNQPLLVVRAADVSIENLQFNADRTFVGEGVLCVGACTRLSVRDSVFEQSASNPGVLSSYGRTNAISAGLSVSGFPGPVGPVELAVHGVVVRTAAGQPEALFRAGVALDRGYGRIGALAAGQGNTIVSRNHDVIVRNAQGGEVRVEGNVLRGFGVQLTTPQASAAALVVTGNLFLPLEEPEAPALAGDFSAMRLISNPAGVPATIQGNTFHGHERGVLIENFPNVLLANNSFTPRPGSGSFQHVVVSNKELFSNATPPPPLPQALALVARGNTFTAGTVAGQGTALMLLNDNAQPLAPGASYYGAVVIGQAGEPNQFLGDFGRYLELGPFDCADSNTAPCPLADLYTAVSASMPGTPVLRFAGDVVAMDNLFDGIAPADMDGSQRNLLLARTLDSASDPALGSVDYGFSAVQPQVFVDDDFAGPHGQAFEFEHPDGSADGRTVYLGVDAFATITGGIAAVAPGGTVFVADGDYAEMVTVAKPLDLVGSGSTATTTIEGGLAITASGSEGARLRLSGLVVSNASGAGLTLGGTVSHLHFDGVAFDGNAGSGVVFAGTGNDDILFSGSVAEACRFQGNGEFGIRTASTAVASRVTLANCTFRDNLAGIVLFGGSSSGGGQIADWLVTDSQFLSNDDADATVWGGGIWIKTGGSGSSIDGFEVLGSVFEDNGSGGLYPGSVPLEDRRFLNRTGIMVRARPQTVLRGVRLCDNSYRETATPGTQETGVYVVDQASGTPGGDYQPVEICGSTLADGLMEGISGYEQYITGGGEPAVNLSGTVTLANGGMGWNHVRLAQQDSVYVDDDFAGLPTGTPVAVDHPAAAPANAVIGLDAFATIVEALEQVADGGAIYVEAGDYRESAGPGQVLAITRAVRLVGAQAGDDARGRADAGASVVRPGVGDAGLGATTLGSMAIFDIAADDVTVEGFLLDADNPDIATGFAMGGADPDVDSGIFATGSRITLARNVYRSFVGAGVYGYSDGGGDTGNAVVQSRFENAVAPSRWGLGVIVANNWYATIADNAMDTVRLGVQTNNFHAADPGGAGGTIAGNAINATRHGIFHNLFYGSATTWSLQDNAITAVGDAAETARWSGIWVESMGGAQTAILSGNVIEASAVSGRLAYGYELNNWTSSAAAATTISGGSVAGADIGVLSTDATAYTGPVSDVRIEGVAFSGIGMASVMVEDTTGIAGAARATLGAGNSFDASVPVLALAGPGATVGFDGIGGVDSVLVRSAGEFVYGAAGFGGLLTREPALVATGIAAANPGGRVTLEAGAFAQNVVVDKTLTLAGPWAGIPGHDATRDGSGEAVLEPAAGSALRLAATGVVVDGITISNTTGAAVLQGGTERDGMQFVNNRVVAIADGAGIRFEPGEGNPASGFTVRDNLFSAIRGAGINGSGVQLYKGTRDAVVSGNHFDGMQNHAIQVNGGNGDVVGVLVSGNVAVDSQSLGSGTAFVLTNTTDVEFTRNSADGVGGGLFISDGTTGLTATCNAFSVSGYALSSSDFFGNAANAGIRIFHNALLAAGGLHNGMQQGLVVGPNWYGGSVPVLTDSGGGLLVAEALTSSPIGNAACGDDTPAQFIQLAGSPQAADVHQPFAQPLQVRVLDALGGAVMGEAVTFSAPPSGASALLAPASGAIQLTDYDGMAGATAVANGFAGSYAVDAGHALGLATFSLTNNAPAQVQFDLNGPVGGVEVGDEVAYTGFLGNEGAQVAENVRVRVQLAATLPLSVGDVTMCVVDPDTAQCLPLDMAESGGGLVFDFPDALGDLDGFSIAAPYAFVHAFRTSYARADVFTASAQVVGVDSGTVYAMDVIATEVIDQHAGVVLDLNGPVAGVEKDVATAYSARLSNIAADVADPVLVEFVITRAGGIVAGDLSLEYDSGGGVFLPLALDETGGQLVGRFGPGDGFPLPSGYDATTAFRATFHAAPDTYHVAATVLDASANADGVAVYAADQLATEVVEADPDVTLALSGLFDVADGTTLVAAAVGRPALMRAELANRGGEVADPVRAAFTIAPGIEQIAEDDIVASYWPVLPSEECAPAPDPGDRETMAFTETQEVLTATTTPRTLAEDSTQVLCFEFAFQRAGVYPIGVVIEDAGDDSDGTGTYAGDTLAVTVAKGEAQVTIDPATLAQGYDGTARVVTASTAPAGLPLEFVYNGSPTAPVAAGTYEVLARIVSDDWQGSASATLTVARAPAEVTLGGLAVVYDGLPHAATADTNPAGLDVAFTYDGGSAPPIDAGSYAVVATVTDPNYTGSASAVMTVLPAPVELVFGNLAHVYDGTGKSASVATVPDGVAGVSLAYAPDAVPVAAGSYTVTATLANSNYTLQGPDSATLVIDKATAQVTLSDLTRLFDGSPKPVTAVASPSVASLLVTYEGGTQAPSAVGSYAVLATVADPNYQGSADGTLTILAAALSGFEAVGPTSFAGVAGVALAGALPTVRVTDQEGNGVASVSVRFEAGSGSIPAAGGSIQTVTTDADGMATVSGWLLDTMAGTGLMSAQVSGLAGLPVIEFSATGAEHADIGISKTSAEPVVRAGEVVDYTLAVTNLGPSDAQAVEIADLLPAELDVATAGWACIAAGGADCGGTDTGAGNVAVVAALPVGGAITILLSATVHDDAAEAPFDNVATASLASGEDGNPGNDSATSTVTVVAPAPTEPAVFKDGFEALPAQAGGPDR